MQLNRSEIQSILPHRKPLLLIDHVSDLVPGVSVQAELSVDPSWDIFSGHFPEKPVLPGIYITESMAQAADLMLLSVPENIGRFPLFFQIRQMRFLRPVFPGDTLQLSACVLTVSDDLYDCSVTAFTDGHKAASGTITIALRQTF